MNPGPPPRNIQLDPLPFRFKYKDTQERMNEVLEKQADIDTVPTDVDKKAFNLRLRNKEKELGHSTFRIKSRTDVEKLNTQYEDDLRVLDCEVMSTIPKRRLSMPIATKLFERRMAQELEARKLKSNKDVIIPKD